MNDDTTATVWVCPRHGKYPERDWRRFGIDAKACPGCVDELKIRDRQLQDAERARQAWTNAGIPQRFDNRRFENFRDRTNALAGRVRAVKTWAENPDADQGLVLLGPPGLGKTHLIVAAIAGYMKALNRRAQYHVASEWLQQVRSGYDRDATTKAEKIIANINSTWLWAMDEIGATTRTEWERQQLGALIDERYREGGRFILAGNVSPKELPDVIGDRGADRLNEIALVLNFAGSSYRTEARDDPELSNPRTDFLKPTPTPVTVNREGVDYPEHDT